MRRGPVTNADVQEALMIGYPRYHEKLLASGYKLARDMPIKLADINNHIPAFQKSQISGLIESFVLVPFNLVPEAIPEKSEFANPYLYVIYTKSR